MVALTVPLADNDVAVATLAGDTSVDVAALPNDLENGATILFNEGLSTQQLVTLTAAATAGSTNITVEPLSSDLTAAETGTTQPDTSITVNALTGPIAGGTPLVFNLGLATQSQVILTEDADVGDTTLNFKNIIVDILPGYVAEYVARTQILGGTGSGLNVNPNREGIQFFEDERGFEDAAITNGTWEVPWSGAFVPQDVGYLSCQEAAFQSPSNGREIFVWIEQPPAPGNAVGDRSKGASVITGFQIVNNSSAIQTVSWTFSGNGSVFDEFNQVNP